MIPPAMDHLSSDESAHIGPRPLHSRPHPLHSRSNLPLGLAVPQPPPHQLSCQSLPPHRQTHSLPLTQGEGPPGTVPPLPHCHHHYLELMTSIVWTSVGGSPSVVMMSQHRRHEDRSTSLGLQMNSAGPCDLSYQRHLVTTRRHTLTSHSI